MLKVSNTHVGAFAKNVSCCGQCSHKHRVNYQKGIKMSVPTSQETIKANVLPQSYSSTHFRVLASLLTSYVSGLGLYFSRFYAFSMPLTYSLSTLFVSSLCVHAYSSVNAMYAKNVAALSRLSYFSLLSKAVLKQLSLLVHVGFESVIALHGALKGSRNMLLSAIMALSHSLMEILSEYNGLFPDISLIPSLLHKKAFTLRIGDWFNPLLTKHEDDDDFGLAFVPIKDFLSSSPSYFMFSYVALNAFLTPIFSYYVTITLANIGAAFYFAAHKHIIDKTFSSVDLLKGDIDVTYAHLIILVMSGFSCFALFNEYRSHAIVYASKSSFVVFDWINSTMNPFIAASIWSFVMFKSCFNTCTTQSDVCVDSNDEKEQGMSIVYQLSAWVSGIIASVELGEFLKTNYTISQYSTMLYSSIAVITSYIVDYAFMSGDAKIKLSDKELTPHSSLSFSSKSTVAIGRSSKSNANNKANTLQLK